MVRLFLASEEDAPAPEAEESEPGQRSARQSVKAKKTASAMAMKGKKTAQRRSPSDSELPDRCPRREQARKHEVNPDKRSIKNPPGILAAAARKVGIAGTRHLPRRRRSSGSRSGIPWRPGGALGCTGKPAAVVPPRWLVAFVRRFKGALGC